MASVNSSSLACWMECVDGGGSYRRFNAAVIGVTLPSIALLGIALNLIAAVVLTRRALRRPANDYLAALAISDAFVDLTAIFLYPVLVFECSSPAVSNLHSSFAPILFPLSAAAQTCSIYFTLVAAVDCFVAACRRRPKSRSNNTGTVSVKVIAAVCVFAFAYSSVHLFELRRVECFAAAFNTTITRLWPTAFRQNKTYYKIFYTYGYTIFKAIGPLVLLIFLNSFIVWRSFSAAKSSRNQSTAENDTDQDDDGTTTLILVVFLFIFCNVLGLIVNLLELKKPPLTFISYLVDVSNLLVVFNSSANFFIYWIFNAKFRSTLVKLCSSKEHHHSSEVLVQIGASKTGFSTRTRTASYASINQRERRPSKTCQLHHRTSLCAAVNHQERRASKTGFARVNGSSSKVARALPTTTSGYVDLKTCVESAEQRSPLSRELGGATPTSQNMNALGKSWLFIDSDVEECQESLLQQPLVSKRVTLISNGQWRRDSLFLAPLTKNLRFNARKASCL